MLREFIILAAGKRIPLQETMFFLGWSWWCEWMMPWELLWGRKRELRCQSDKASLCERSVGTWGLGREARKTTMELRYGGGPICENVWGTFMERHQLICCQEHPAVTSFTHKSLLRAFIWTPRDVWVTFCFSTAVFSISGCHEVFGGEGNSAPKGGWVGSRGLINRCHTEAGEESKGNSAAHALALGVFVRTSVTALERTRTNWKWGPHREIEICYQEKIRPEKRVILLVWLSGACKGESQEGRRGSVNVTQFRWTENGWRRDSVCLFISRWRIYNDSSGWLSGSK